MSGHMADDVFGIVGSVQAGAYRVQEVVAEGGFAVVYRAYHEAFRAEVALKCLKVPDSLSTASQQEFLERFREEGELLFRLSASTRAVVRPLHVGTLEGVARFVPFIALEWLNGETLDSFIHRRSANKEPPLPLDAALTLMTPVARTLERAHHFPGPNGPICILHRDLKPDNIFIADVHGQQTAKILDFGIGKVKSVATQMVGHQSATAEGLVAFTPAYGAPEQWLPKRYGQSGPWTDVWGLALTVVAALIGRDPFEGDQAALIGSAIDPGRRPTPGAEGVETPQAVERVFERALAVDPRDRYTDVGAFWTDLLKAAGVREHTLSMFPPTAPTSQGGSPPERRADPMAATKPVHHPVPELDLGSLPAKKAEPARAEPKRAPKITLARDGKDIGAPIREIELGGKMLEDESEDYPPRRGAPVRRATGPSGALDGVGVSARNVPLRPQAARYGGPVDPGTGTRELKQNLRGPIKLVIIGMLVMIAEFVYSSQTGDLVRFGPVRPLWIAGPLVVLGLGLAIARFIQHAR